MKLQNFFRMQAIVIGLGAALFLAGAAQAQEIDNATFDEGANSVPFTQQAAANNSVQSGAAHSGAATVANSNAAPAAVVAQESVISEKTPAKGWIVAMLTVCFAWTVLYIRTEFSGRTLDPNRRAADQVNNRAVQS